MALPLGLSSLAPFPSRPGMMGLGLPGRLVGVMLAVTALSLAALATILSATGLTLATEFARFVLLALGMVGLAAYCRLRQLHWGVTDSAITVGFITGTLLLCGLISTTGLRLGLPLADGALARGDAVIGLDVREFVRFTAGHPAFAAVLHFAYNASSLLCVAAIVWSLVKGDRAGMWRAAATIGLAMHVTGLVSVMFPARGAITTFGLDALQGRGLPVGAGTYFAKAFTHFYSGTETAVTLADMNGVVCFPSFHTVMALVILQGFAGTRLKWFAAAWSALTIVSTVPMGGHYVVDLVAGGAVWLGSYLAANWACQGFAREEADAAVQAGVPARTAPRAARPRATLTPLAR
jgi:hypothetical protein